jgi:DNA-binding transcriptional MerR regulator
MDFAGRSILIDVAGDIAQGPCATLKRFNPGSVFSLLPSVSLLEQCMQQCIRATTRIGNGMGIKTGVPLASTGHYRSGVAARLSGLHPETLRVWERRYAIVGPQRSFGGQRLYSAFDVRRLIHIKQLVDLGHAIGVVAALSPSSLSSMHAAALERDLFGGRAGPGVPANTTGQTTPEPASREQAPVRTALVGAMLVADNLQQLIDDARLCLVARCPDASTASSALSQIKAELLITEMPKLDSHAEAMVSKLVHACSAERAVVYYRHASTAVIRRLRRAGHTVTRSPSAVVAIESQAVASLSAAECSAQAVPGGVDFALTDGPDHGDTLRLSRLLLELLAFEREDCASVTWSVEQKQCRAELRRMVSQTRQLLRRSLRFATASTAGNAALLVLRG